MLAKFTKLGGRRDVKTAHSFKNVFNKQGYQLLIAVRLYYLVVMAAFDIPLLFQW